MSHSKYIILLIQEIRESLSWISGLCVEEGKRVMDHETKVWHIPVTVWWKEEKYRYGEVWHIVTVSCQGVVTGRDVWWQDHHYQSIPQQHTSTCFETQYSLSWFWPLWYLRFPCVSTEKVVPYHHQVLSDSRMDVSRPKHHTSDSCFCRLIFTYCIYCVWQVERDSGQSLGANYFY